MTENGKPKSTIDFTEDWNLPVKPEEVESFTFELKDPFIVEGADGSATFLREPRSQSEKDLYLRILGRSFVQFFSGSSEDHYTRDESGEYLRVRRGFHAEDMRRHLAGEWPSVLSIPILPDGNCHWGCVDCDRHEDADPPIDHAALAKRVTELGLNLVVCKSKNPKSAHLFLFLKEKNGFPAVTVQRLLEKYVRLLGITGEVELFPKQSELKPGQIGNGVNVCYHGQERIAFGKVGEPLDIMGFLLLAQERQVFGQVLEDRDLANAPETSVKSAKGDRPLPIGVIRDLHVKNLDSLRCSKTGARNDTLNTVCFFAARAFAAGALEGDEDSIREEIHTVAIATGMGESEINTTGNSGWSKGIAQPLLILDPENAHAEALVRVDEWLGDRDAENPPVKPESEGAYQDLALLTDEEFEERRDLAAKRLGIRKEALDRFVGKRRAKQIEETDLGLDADLRDCTPWETPVDGAEVLAKVAAAYRRFIIFKNPFDAEVMATWALGTFLYEEYSIFPRLSFTSPFPDSGKTTCIDCLDHTCQRASRADNLTTAVIFRIIEAFHPCLLLDEADTFMKDNVEMTGVLNSGHRRGGRIYRMAKVDDVQTFEKFNTYGPLAYGMLGHPTGTLFSRTIFIRLERKSAKQHTEDFDTDENPTLADELTVLRRQLARWAVDHRTDVKNAKPDTGTLINRNRNNWKALLKVAHVVGSDWTNIILTAAGVPPPIVKKTAQEKLLRDVRNIFHTREVDRLPSALLLADLLLQKESGWYRFHNGREAMGFEDLAELLYDFEVEPKPISFNKAVQFTLFEEAEDKPVTLRGYTLEQFSILFEKYLSGVPEQVTTQGKWGKQPF